MKSYYFLMHFRFFVSLDKFPVSLRMFGSVQIHVLFLLKRKKCEINHLLCHLKRKEPDLFNI